QAQAATDSTAPVGAAGAPTGAGSCRGGRRSVLVPDVVVVLVADLDERPRGDDGREHDDRDDQDLEKHGRLLGAEGLTTSVYAWERAASCSSLRRETRRLRTVTTVSTTTIVSSDTGVGTVGTAGHTVCAQCSTSFTPMNARMSARPWLRYTSLASTAWSTKYSARRP